MVSLGPINTETALLSPSQAQVPPTEVFTFEIRLGFSPVMKLQFALVKTEVMIYSNPFNFSGKKGQNWRLWLIGMLSGKRHSLLVHSRGTRVPLTPGQHILSSSEEKLLFHERGGERGSEVPHKDTCDIENGDARTSFRVRLI